MSNFNIGDSVEVLPCENDAGLDAWQIAEWERVSGKQGKVVEIAHFSDGQDIRLRFSDPCHPDVWCRPAWLRRVKRGPRNLGASEAGRTQSATSVYSEGTAGATLGGREVILGSRPCDVCGEVVTLLPGQRMFETCSRCFMRLPPPSQDAPSRPQGARTGPSEGKSDSRAIGEPTPVTGPRYKVGDFVDMGEFKRGEVLAIDAEPRYSVQWPDGCVQCIKESTLRPHVAAPAKCAPDGTRCEEWQNSGSRHRMEAQEFRFCPFCGGKLQNDRDDA